MARECMSLPFKRACSLQGVGYSDARLYDGFLESRLHPSDILSARQIMAIISESLKTCSMPTDFISIFQVAADHQRHHTLFSCMDQLVL